MHGSNRLGGNSLSDLLVFGRRAGAGAAAYVAVLGDQRPAVADDDVERGGGGGARPRSPTDAGENPYTLHQELQQTMNDLVGIIRREGEMKEALTRLDRPSASGCRTVSVEGHRQFNPGWHLALDLRNMLLVSECIALAALERQESRGGHTREDHPGMDPTLARRQPRLPPARPRRPGRGGHADPSAGPDDARATCSSCSTARSSASTYTPAELSVLDDPSCSGQFPGGPAMTYDASFRVWRGDAGGGALVTSPWRSTRARSCSTSSTGCRRRRHRTWRCAGTARPASAAPAAPRSTADRGCCA